MTKNYRIKSVHRGHVTIYEGTLDEFINNVFGYTLECGNSWNHKIPVRPKTIKSLVKAINDSKIACNHYDDWVAIATDEEVAQYGTHPAA